VEDDGVMKLVDGFRVTEVSTKVVDDVGLSVVVIVIGEVLAIVDDSVPEVSVNVLESLVWLTGGSMGNSDSVGAIVSVVGDGK
jgi:hypothetical protein